MRRILRAETAHGQGRQRTLSLLAVVTLLLMVSGVSSSPPVTQIEIVPPTVVVGSDPEGGPTTFELEARLWTGPKANRLSAAAPEAPGDLKWTVGPWLTQEVQSGNRVILQLPPGVLPTSPAAVNASLGGITSAPGPEIRFATPLAVPGQDVLTSGYTPDGQPNVVLVNGKWDDTERCAVRLFAFVRRTPLGNVDQCAGTDPGWGAAVLAEDHAMTFTPAEWSGDVTMEAGPSQRPVRSLPVVLRVVVGKGVDPNKVRNLAMADIDVASGILARSRAGISLNVVDHSETASAVPTLVSDCLSGDDLRNQGDPELTPESQPGAALYLYYVNAMGNARGLACAGNDAHPQAAIFISWEAQSATTLVHEVGHALGLTLPGKGHSDDLSGFDVGNVMTSGINDQDPNGRNRFSVGQVFRMNVDQASWLNWAADAAGVPVREPSAPRMGCQCGEQDPSGRCPRLIDDVAPPSDRTGDTHAWDCFDEVGLPNEVFGQDQPVGLLAGQRWRAQRGICSRDLPGLPDEHWSASYVRFDNVSRPGSCPSWVAIFFRKFGVIYRALPEGHDIAWSDGADFWPKTGTPPPDLFPVTVHLYYPASRVVQIETDIDDATRIFGENNRTGIRLVFDRNPDSPCSPGATTGTDFKICYVAALSTGTSLLASGIRVAGPASGTHTVAHYLGRALGLAPLGAGDTRFPGNLMRPTSGTRGDKLTLGQVFQMNVNLRPDLPRCLPDPLVCPALEADVTP